MYSSTILKRTRAQEFADRDAIGDFTTEAMTKLGLAMKASVGEVDASLLLQDIAEGYARAARRASARYDQRVAEDAAAVASGLVEGEQDEDTGAFYFYSDAQHISRHAAETAISAMVGALDAYRNVTGSECALPSTPDGWEIVQEA